MKRVVIIGSTSAQAEHIIRDAILHVYSVNRKAWQSYFKKNEHSSSHYTYAQWIVDHVEDLFLSASKMH